MIPRYLDSETLLEISYDHSSNCPTLLVVSLFDTMVSTWYDTRGGEKHNQEAYSGLCRWGDCFVVPPRNDIRVSRVKNII
ncbi:MAG: hypothetical protein MAG451_01207 [Anaerolineales bacterium]|nr:hypothetical protein [Anaerolineales bacterium]